MATYEDLYGKRIKVFDSDPTLTSSYEGQVWYDSSTGVLKSVVALESFISVSALNTARDYLQVGSVGTQTAGIAFGGRTHPPESFKNETEEYNGSGWSESGNLNDARFSGAGFGTQTAAVMAGGNRPSGSPDGRSDVEEYDGSSWTNATDIPTGRYGAMGAGTLTAGIVAGGATGNYPFTAQSTSFEYDGTNWTSGGTMNKGRWIGASGGPQTAALFFGGFDTTSSPNTTNTESYDGTSFTALSALPTAVSSNMGSGDTSSAVSYGGGNPSAVTTAFTWDGSSWSTSPATLGTARNRGSSSGTGSAAITGGGSPPVAGLSISEEYNKSINTITAAAWASGGALNTARYENAGTGSQTAGLTSGGAEPSFSNKTEEYDGSSWSNVTAYPISTRGMGAAGTQTSAVFWGGDSPPGDTITTTNEYDGSSWTGGGALTYDITTGGTGGTGTQTAGLMIAGYHKPENTAVNYVQEYNGSAWSANPNAYPTATFSVVQTGTATAALAAGGGTPAPATPTNAFEYDGTSFSATGSLIEATENAGAGGIQTAAITMGKGNNSSPTFVQGYDGTSFSTRPSIATGRRSMASGKNASTAELTWMAGGYTTTVVANTEEFTGETSTIPSKTLTTS